MYPFFLFVKDFLLTFALIEKDNGNNIETKNVRA